MTSSVCLKCMFAHLQRIFKLQKLSTMNGEMARVENLNKMFHFAQSIHIWNFFHFILNRKKWRPERVDCCVYFEGSLYACLWGERGPKMKMKRKREWSNKVARIARQQQKDKVNWGRQKCKCSRLLLVHNTDLHTPMTCIHLKVWQNICI